MNILNKQYIVELSYIYLADIYVQLHSTQYSFGVSKLSFKKRTNTIYIEFLRFHPFSLIQDFSLNFWIIFTPTKQSQHFTDTIL